MLHPAPLPLGVPLYAHDRGIAIDILHHRGHERNQSFDRLVRRGGRVDDDQYIIRARFHQAINSSEMLAHRVDHGKTDQITPVILIFPGRGQILPDPELDLDAPLSQIQHDADRGLPLPGPSALAAHPASQLRLPQGQWLLMGHPGSAPRLRALLDPDANQAQALRAVAAHALAQLHPGYALNLRASPTSQTAALCRMGLQA